jgi:hypothetical protein
MLFGGRPLPEMSRAVRLLIVVLVILAASQNSTIRFTVTRLMDRFVKMSADQVEARLPSRLPGGLAARLRS